MNVDIEWVREVRQKINVCTEAQMPHQWRKAWRIVKGVGPTPIGKVQLSAWQGGFTSADENGVFHYDGLTEQLKLLFHPVQLNVSTGGARTGGSSRGMKVDRELEKLINHGTIPETLHRYTIKTMRQLRSENLRPFWAQVAVGDKQLKLATALDMLCVDANGHVVNVQLKTGYDRNYDTARGHLMVPFADNREECKCDAIARLPDCFASRNMLQLISENMILQRNHAGLIDRSLLMVISEHVHRVVEMPPTMENIQRGLAANLLVRTQFNSLQTNLDSIRRAYAVRQIMKSKPRTGKTAAATKVKLTKIKKQK
jgi:hypothetical protein